MWRTAPSSSPNVELLGDGGVHVQIPRNFLFHKHSVAKHLRAFKQAV